MCVGGWVGGWVGVGGCTCLHAHKHKLKHTVNVQYVRMHMHVYNHSRRATRTGIRRVCGRMYAQPHMYVCTATYVRMHSHICMYAQSHMYVCTVIPAGQRGRVSGEFVAVCMHSHICMYAQSHMYVCTVTYVCMYSHFRWATRTGIRRVRGRCRSHGLGWASPSLCLRLSSVM